MELVLILRLVVDPAFLAHPQPFIAARGNVLELRLAQREARGGLHLLMGQRPVQQAAPAAADVQDVLRPRYSRRVEVVVQLASLCCRQVLGVVALVPQGA